MITETRTAGAISGPPDILAALHQASAKTGSDFNYLLGTAMRESSLKTQAQSTTSSATGLFQFIDQTWLGLVKRFGSSNGLGSYADAIHQSDDGHYSVASAETKSAILALRKDPTVAALIAGEAASETKMGMEDTLGRQVSCGELYAAHFLGQGSACRLIAMNASNPGQRADLAFPAAAKSNRSVFYNADGTAKTVGAIYDWAIRLPNGADNTRSEPAAVQASPLTTSAPRALRASFDIAGNSSVENAPHYWRSHSADADQTTNTRSAYSSPLSIPARATAFVGMPRTASLVLTPGVIDILASLNAGTAFATARRTN